MASFSAPPCPFLFEASYDTGSRSVAEATGLGKAVSGMQSFNPCLTTEERVLGLEPLLT